MNNTTKRTTLVIGASAGIGEALAGLRPTGNEPCDRGDSVYVTGKMPGTDCSRCQKALDADGCVP